MSTVWPGTPRGRSYQRGQSATAVWATRVVFAGNGVLFATWVSRIPATRDRLGVDEAGLGLALLSLGLGSLVAMPWTGRAVDRFGARRVLTVVVAAAGVLFPALAFAPSLATLGSVLLVLGAAYGVWDVAMNVAGNAVERSGRRTLMPGFHAAWSIGGVLGAVVGSLVARAEIGTTSQFVAVAVVVGAVCLASIAALPDARDRPIEALTSPGITEPAQAPPAGRLLRDPRFVAIALLTFTVAWAEGSANDWLALLLADERSASQSQAAAGFAVFATAMTIGRLAGGRVVDRVGRVRVLHGGAVVATGGVVLLLVWPVLPVAYVGATAWGLGISVVFPLAISAAGQTPGQPARAITVASTLGYGAFLVGPPVIGRLAAAVGLGNALWLVVAMTLAVGALAARTR